MSAPSMHMDDLFFSCKTPYINQNHSVSHPGQDNHDAVELQSIPNVSVVCY